jgi:hypothetical protein
VYFEAENAELPANFEPWRLFRIMVLNGHNFETLNGWFDKQEGNNIAKRATALVREEVKNFL